MNIFAGKTALVTGAGSGIGRELALQLADQGANVAVTDIVPERLEAVVAELRKMGVRAAGYRVDHARLTEVKQFARDFFSQWGQIDILCCNAGVGAGADLKETTIEDWEWVMGVNLWGVIYMVQLFVPSMIERRNGRILITASAAGLIGLPGMAPYCTSKFALVGLAESLRGELYKHNIRVSALCPGIIDTNIIQGGKILFKDRRGSTVQPNVARFYATYGCSPSIVARDGLRALSRDTGIKVSPWFQMWPVYLLKRFSPTIYQGVARFLFKYILFRKRR